MLFSVVYGFCKEYGYCRGSNIFLASKIGLTTKNGIKKLLDVLEASHLIERSYSDDGFHRQITLTGRQHSLPTTNEREQHSLPAKATSVASTGNGDIPPRQQALPHDRLSDKQIDKTLERIAASPPQSSSVCDSLGKANPEGISLDEIKKRGLTIHNIHRHFERVGRLESMKDLETSIERFGPVLTLVEIAYRYHAPSPKKKTAQWRREMEFESVALYGMTTGQVREADKAKRATG